MPSARASRTRLLSLVSGLMSIVALLILCPTLTAQEALSDGDPGAGSITGVVVEEITERPLARASVTLDGERQALTGSDGRFRFEAVDAGRHEVAVSYLGFRGARQTVEVASGEPATVRLLLEPDVVEVAELVVQMPPTRASWVRDDLQRSFREGGRLYTHRDLDRMGFEYLEGLFRRIPGHELVGNRTDFAFISPDPRAPHSANVLLRVHGRTCPVHLYLDGGKVPAFYLDHILAENVAAVAILAGPQSVRGECGVISVLSRRATDMDAQP